MPRVNNWTVNQLEYKHRFFVRRREQTMTYEIVAKIGKAGKKEVNLVSWNGSPAKIDIREWYEDDRCGKGITLTDDEARELYETLKGRYE